MDLTFSESQELLRKAAHEFLDEECPASFVRDLEETSEGYSLELWHKMADLGWLGLGYPEEYGGAERDVVDLAILFEEMGYALLPSPYSSTVVQSGLPLLIAGTNQQKERFLPGIVNGDTLFSLAVLEPTTSYNPEDITASAIADGQDYVIKGTKLFVHNAHLANWILCVTRTQESSKDCKGISLFLVESGSKGLECTLTRDIAGRQMYEVQFDSVRVPKENLVGELHQGWESLAKALDIATTLQSAEIAGICKKVLEISVDWAKQRVQFDKPIGFFQAVQHKCVNMQVKIEETKVLVYTAAARLSQGLPSRMAVAQAKAFAGDTAQYVAYEGHQVFAGTGFMQDHDMQLYSRRLKAAEFDMGDADFHRKTITEELASSSQQLTLLQ